jgi:hypothetical protein
VKRAFLVSSAILLAGCSAKYSTNNIQERTEHLVKNVSVVISQPTDGVYETHTYSGSGRATADAVKAAFLRHSDNVTVFADCDDVTCLKANHSVSRGYYVVPQILHWEDRATEWSGIPDKIEVKITVYNAESNNRVASTIINGKSKWATFGGDHPQDLLPEPINMFVSNLY